MGQEVDWLAAVGDIEEAAALKRRAEEAEAAYNAALAQARDEAHRIGAEAKAAIDKELAALLAKADAEIGVKSQESEGRIGEIHASAARSVEEVARDAAAAIIERFLPAQLDDAEASAVIQAIVAELGASSMKDMGRVMAEVKSRHASSIEPARASALVRAALA